MLSSYYAPDIAHTAALSYFLHGLYELLQSICKVERAKPRPHRPATAAFPLPNLVHPHLPAMPLFPFDVASTAASAVGVFLYLVTAVVRLALARRAQAQEHEREPRRGHAHAAHIVCLVARHVLDVQRPIEPSASNWPPNVWFPHVMLNFSPTEGTTRYLMMSP